MYFLSMFVVSGEYQTEMFEYSITAGWKKMQVFLKLQKVF